MMKMAARVLLRMGIGLLIISVVIRPAIRTETGMMGDNFAIIACLVLILTAALGIRFAPDEPVNNLPDRDHAAAARPATIKQKRSRRGADR
jgi:hypothetical protein